MIQGFIRNGPARDHFKLENSKNEYLGSTLKQSKRNIYFMMPTVRFRRLAASVAASDPQDRDICKLSKGPTKLKYTKNILNTLE